MNRRKGKVYIVGAGPGDGELVTLKALRAIRTADVIFYDELANSSLLSNASENAKLVYVGKKAGCHSVPQNDIEKLLVKEASSGRTVCRLKGGDPFIFGRGGEELLRLAKNKIPYEVVPGITSAIAAPAYAGIPITQRGMTSGVAIFTGHEDPTKDASDLNWDAIANLKTTLVFLMGMNNLSLIVKELVKHGMDSGTPVAIIHRGTTPSQKTVTGTLKNIVSVVEREGIGAPSVIVVGRVVSLREKLAWFEKKPLFGKKIVVTRTRKQMSGLAGKLSENGANVCEFPTIEIIPNKDAYPELDAAIENLANFDWVIFTSANGVEVFFDRILYLSKDARSFAGVGVCAIGPATSEKLREYGIRADVVPDKYIAEAVAEAIKDKVSGRKVLLPRADIARKDISVLLKKYGADITEIPIYVTTRPETKPNELEELLAGADLVTFTSSSTADNFAAILGRGLKKNLNGVKGVSIGPVTTEAMKKNKIPIACEAKDYTIPGLVDAIIKYFGEAKA